MKIGLIMISNRPDNLAKFVQNLDRLGEFGDHLVKSVLIQSPFSGNESCLGEFDRVGHDDAVDSRVEAVPFLRYRRKAMALVGDCDWFWQIGDDHVLRDSKGEVFSKTLSEYYMDVLDFISANNRIGVVSCKGFFGGRCAGYRFNTNPTNGLISADNGGIFFKNIGIDSIISYEDAMLVGAIEEMLVSFNIISEGYGFARRFNSPVTTPKYKKIGDAISYSIDTLDANIQGRIRQKFNSPYWNFEEKKFPKQIMDMINEYSIR